MGSAVSETWFIPIAKRDVATMAKAAVNSGKKFAARIQKKQGDDERGHNGLA